MTRLKLIIALCGALQIFTVGSSAQAQSFDFELGYAARETRPTTDNDLFLFTTGVVWGEDKAFTRMEVETGVRNEDFSGAYPLYLALDVSRAALRGPHVYAGGLRTSYAEDMATTAEAYGTYEFWWSRSGLRATLGAQRAFDDVPGRSSWGGFGLVEWSYYMRDHWVMRAGLQSDTDGTLAAIGTEWRFGQSDFSVVAEAAFATDRYTGIDSYENLSVSFRYAPGSSSLYQRDRLRGFRLSHRYVGVQ